MAMAPAIRPHGGPGDDGVYRSILTAARGVREDVAGPADGDAVADLRRGRWLGGSDDAEGVAVTADAVAACVGTCGVGTCGVDDGVGDADCGQIVE